MQAKISRHREERSLNWLMGEEPLDLGGVIEQHSHGVRFERPDFLLTFSDANPLQASESSDAGVIDRRSDDLCRALAGSQCSLDRRRRGFI